MKSIAVTQEQFDYLKTIKPHFCLPAYGGMISESYFMSLIKLINLFNFSGINYSIDSIVNESLVTRARNSLVAKMMQFDGHSTHLVFIDSDIEFEPDSVIKLLLANKDVVGGIYPKKALPISYVVNPIENAQLEGSLLEVKRIGTGFVCIKREVFEKMFERYAHLKYNDNIGLDEKYAPYKYALFDTSIDTEDNNNYLSEDYTFCDRWRAMGGKIWADLSISLTHVGYFKFKGVSPLEAVSMANKQVSANTTDSKVIKLTFDDGPSEYTSIILDILKKHDVKATFFVIGNHIVGNEELLKRMVAEGHEIGNHTLTHADYPVNQDQAKIEIEETDRLILETTGISNQIYRLPGDKKDTGVYSYLIDQNKNTVGWDIEGNDWDLTRTNEDSIVKTILDGIEILNKNEYVIDLHDGCGDPEEKQAQLGGNSRINTANALEKIIPKLKEMGFVFQTISN